MLVSRKFIFIGIAVALTVLSIGVDAEEFAAPLPPPELGDTLTSYKTKQQLLEQGVTASQPQIRIIPKNTAVAKVPREPEARAIHTRSITYLNGSGLKFDIQSNSTFYISVCDGMQFSWPIARVELSNNSFSADLNQEGNQIAIKSNPGGSQLAKLKIYLLNQSKPIEFVLGKKDGNDNYDEARRIQIAQKSPLNNSSSDAGVTNMVISSKSRNSRREVVAKPENKPQQVEMVDLNNNVRVINTSISLEEVSEVADILLNAVIENE